MTTLVKRFLPPLIKRTAGFFIAMILVASLSMMLLFGAVSAYNSYESSVNDYFSCYGYPDARIQTDLTDVNDFIRISAVDGVEKVDIRTFWLSAFKADTRLLTMKLNTFSDDGIIKLYDVETVPKSSEYPNIYLERYMADNNGIKAGDIIKVRFDGDFYDFYVEKIIQSCETINFQVNDLIAGDEKDLGCAYISETEINNFLIKEGLSDNIGKSNEALISISEGSEPADVLERSLETLPDDLDVSFSSVKEDEENIIKINNLLLGCKRVSVLLPLIFYIIMLVVVLLFMMQVIRNNFKEIGILMMIGYKKGDIIGMFSICGFIASLIAVGIGVFGGGYLLDIITGIYSSNNTIPYINAEFDFSALLISSLVTIGVMQIACLLSLLQLKNLTPLSIFQDDFSSGHLKGHGKLLSLLPSDLQIAAGSIKQNPRRAIVSIFAIFAAFVMIFLGLCINQGMNTNRDQIQNERLFYDAQIMVVGDADYEDSEYIKEELLKQDFITAVEQVGMSSVEFTNGKFSDEYTITAMKTDETLAVIPDENNDGSMEIPERGIILVEDHAKEAGVEVGDKISVGGVKLEVKGLSAQYSGKSEFMSFAQLRDMGIDYYIAFFVKTTDEEAMLEWIDEQDIVVYTVFTSNLKDKIKQTSETYSSLTKLEIIFAILISFMVITVMTISSFNEQRRRLSILRVLGYQVSRISMIWIVQFIAYLIPAVVLAVPASTFIGKWFMDILSGKTLTYPFVQDSTLYIASFILIVLMYVASHFVSMFALRRQKLAESIKSRE